MKIKQIYKGLNDIKKLLNKQSIIYIGLSTILVIVISCITPIVSLFYKQMIDLATSNDFAIKSIINVIVIYIMVELIIELLENIQNHINMIVNYVIGNSVTANVNKKLIKVSMEEYENTDTHDLIERVLSKVANGMINTFNTFISILSPALMIFTYAAILYSVKWYFPFILIILNFPYAISLFIQNRNKYKQYTERNKDKRYMQYLTKTLMDRQNAKDIRLYKLLDFLCDKLQVIVSKFHNIPRFS